MQAKAYSLNTKSSIVGVQILPPCLALETRLPFHLALFLDTSTSMSGTRLTSVKHTLHAVINHMSPTDALTLIEYNSAATVLCKQCSDKEQLRFITDALKATNSTNLEKAFHAFPSECIPDTICILTDGDNTEGLSGTEELLFLAKRLLPKGVSICCLGYGEDHNEKLLQTLALKSRGSYTYMSTAEMVPVGVGTIVGALETEVACNASITWSVGECLELLGAEEGTFVIGSLFSEKPQWVLLNIPTESQSDSLSLKWRDRCSGESQSLTVTVEQSEYLNPDVYEQYLRIQCLKAMESAKKVLEEFNYSKYSEQKEVVQTLLAEIDQSSISARPLLIRLRAQMTELLETLKSMPTDVNGLPPPPPAWSFGRLPNNVYLTRLTSDMTTFTIQRGILSARNPDDDPINDLYASPVQRQVTGQITQAYHSQNPDAA